MKTESISYSLFKFIRLVFCDRPNSTPSLYAALHRNILDLCNEYGVQIMTLAYEGDPKDAKVVAKDQG